MYWFLYDKHLPNERVKALLNIYDIVVLRNNLMLLTVKFFCKRAPSSLPASEAKYAFKPLLRI